jgi:hypothetical protein
MRGSGRGVPRGAGAAWGLAPTDGRRPDRVLAYSGPAAACSGGASLFGQWRAGADGRAPVTVRVERHARRVGVRGLAREENGVAKPI